MNITSVNGLTKEHIERFLCEMRRMGVYDDGGNSPEWPFVKGQTVMIRGVPLYYLGTIVRWTSKVLTLTQAAWVRDTGQFEELWRDPSGIDIRRYPADREVHILLDGISDWCEWPHGWPL
jgi:hypothetical protein